MSFIQSTSGLDGGGCLKPRHGYFDPGKEPRSPLYKRVVGPQTQSGQVWRRENLLSVTRFEPHTKP
jgi:hypothetical protein